MSDHGKPTTLRLFAIIVASALIYAISLITAFTLIDEAHGHQRLAAVVILTFLLIIAAGTLANHEEWYLIYIHERLRNLVDGRVVTPKPTKKLPENIEQISQALDYLWADSEETLSKLEAHDALQRRFVSDVSHELKTPLTALKGTAETILDDPDMPAEDRQHFLEVIVSEADRLTRLANDLLTLQRIEGGYLSISQDLIDLTELCQDARKRMVSFTQERNVTLAVVGEAPPVQGDRNLLLQMILNLLENATRFSPAGGTVTLEVFGQEGRSVLIVTDEGTGFGDTDPALLFERFYVGDASRTHRTKTGGTGLGLSIVKSIVLAHGGTVEAVNRPERGAAFYIAIPSA